MKQEVRRGRKFIEYHDPDTQDEFTFTQEISGADVSYQETDGSWHPADENWATDGVDGFILKNDKLNHKVRMKGDGGRSWYPRRNVTSEYMTFGIPEYWNGKRWTKFSFSGWSVEGKTITLQTRQGVTILIHSRWNGIKIDWVLASSAAPSRMRYPVSLTGITYVDGIIYGADGTRLGQLTPTTATDSTFDEEGMPTQLPCSGSYASGYVEFQADVTGAVYPVVIDPDFSVQPDATAGIDTYIRGGAHYGINFGTASSVVVKTASNDNYTRYALIKFSLSGLPTGSTISSATLKVYWCPDYNGEVDVSVYQVLKDWVESQATFINYATSSAWSTEGARNSTDDYNGSVLLASKTVSSEPSDGTEISFVSETAFSTYIQNNAGGSINLIIRDDTAADRNFSFYLSDSATESYRPVLSVTYTAGSTGTLRRTNMNAQMSNLTGGMHG